MRVYLAKWPNGTISVATASDMPDLFQILDEEGNPFSAEVHLLPTHFHVTTTVSRNVIAVGTGESTRRRPKHVSFTQKHYEEYLRRIEP